MVSLTVGGVPPSRAGKMSRRRSWFGRSQVTGKRRLEKTINQEAVALEEKSLTGPANHGGAPAGGKRFQNQGILPIDYRRRRRRLAQAAGPGEPPPAA